MRGPRPFRLFLMVILALTPLVQSFWFVQAWHVIHAVAWTGPRALLQGLLVVAALVVLVVALDLLRVRVLPRRAFGPWGRAIVRLWLIVSCLSVLAMTAVESLAWCSRPAMAALPVAQWVRVEPARHTVFRYATWLAGGLPHLRALKHLNQSIPDQQGLPVVWCCDAITTLCRSTPCWSPSIIPTGWLHHKRSPWSERTG